VVFVLWNTFFLSSGLFPWNIKLNTYRQCRAGQGELCLVVTEDKAGMYSRRQGKQEAGMARQVMSTHECRTAQAGTHMKENCQAAYGRYRRHERQ
jgi:hypothetical protein